MASLLPLSSRSRDRPRIFKARPGPRAAPLQYVVFGVTVLGLLTIVARLCSGSSKDGRKTLYDYYRPAPNPPEPTALPPTYALYHKDRLDLPQHHWENAHPLPSEKFFFVAGHSRNVGWGNGMQEVLMNTYLAYRAKRSFVFANYTWNDNGSLYSEYNGKKIPSQIPYSVMIRGPSVGDPMPAGVDAPRAVSRTYYEKVCAGQKVVIPRGEVLDSLPSPANLNAQAITDAWLDKLATIDSPCVESKKETDQLYNYLVFGDPRAMLEIWPSFAASPVITHFGWSPLVELGFDTNRELFVSPTHLEPYLSNSPFTTNAERYPMIPGLMVVHLRRGDYKEHCVNLANWGSTYLAFNSFPEMLDQFVPPSSGTPAEKQEYVRPHCYPTIPEIVARISALRKTRAGAGLKKLYIMSNGDRQWLQELKTALNRDARWDLITSSRDMVLNHEQKYVAQAVDMLVGQRAQLFVGNGFSTLSSNIVTMRMANHFPSDSTRFW
ncbi:hypothetical protein GY45DRAFT_1320769 [Cubamyces sp. BRFM 1775]|nr:hypothetical protein GY45DRAFT_1320769 [Cubamyces sp. BRFM 1775]